MVEQILQTAIVRGVRLWPQAGRLRYRGPEAQITPALVRQLQAQKAALLDHLTAPTYAPLSVGQQGLWYVQQSAPQSVAYHVSLPLRIHRALDRALLHNAVQLLVDRHAALRTTFPLRDHVPVQQIAGYQAAAFTVVEAGGWSEATLLDAIRAEYERPFDLAAGPLFRVTLFAQSAQEQVLQISAHHLVIDGWSSYLLLDELFALYAALQQGVPAPLPALDHTYADYVTWQQDLLAHTGEQLWAYWHEQLTGELPVLQLPADYKRPALLSYRGLSHSFALSAELSQALKRLAQQQGCTLYVLLLAAYQVLLYRYSGQDELLIGLPMAGRSRPEFANVVGYFTSPVVVRSVLQDELSFTQLLAQVRRQVLGALDHQDYPFPWLVERLNPPRDQRHSPIFQADFVLQKPHRAQELFLHNGPVERAGLLVEPVPLRLFAGRVDLALELMEGTAQVHGHVHANADLFAPETVARLAGHFQTVLQGIVRQPDQPIGMIPLLTTAERHQLLVAWSAPASALDNCDSVAAATPTIQQLFAEQVMRTPEALAVVFDQGTGEQGDKALAAHPAAPASAHLVTLSYAELDARANQLAHYLQQQGVGPEVLVGIALDRSLEMIVGILGVLKAGGAYLPLDPHYPNERLAFMLADAQPAVVLTQAALCERLTTLGNLDDIPPLLCLDSEWPVVAQQPTTPPPSTAGPEHLAYVIYTSGSTGQPKGVLVEQRGLYNLAQAQIRAFGVTPASRVWQFASLNFDASASEIAMALCAGASLHLPPPGPPLLGAPLAERLNAQAITHITLTPSTLATLEPQWLTTLETLIVAGEACSPELFRRWAVGRRFLNAYGPTETTVCATMMDCTGFTPRHADQPPPIGRPIDNMQVYILDAHQQPQPIGLPGEIYIGGVGVARGYLNRPALTAERFIEMESGDWGLETREQVAIANHQPLLRLYKTGDLARWLPDGTIEYLGRRDEQVKIHGVRLELGEIEAVLRQHPAVQDAVVVVHTDEGGEKRLAAYWVDRDQETGGQGDKGKLRDYVQTKLPVAMIPATFVRLDALPLTPNGKVDRKALPPPDYTGTQSAPYAPPQTPTEARLATIWGEVLGAPQIGRHDNFFALGGHSLLATQVVSRIRQGLRLNPPLHLLFTTTTLAALAAALDQLRATTIDAPPLVIPPVDRRRPLPLSSAQERLWFLHQFDHADQAYNMPAAWRLRGELDVNALERSFQELARRHESLRTTFALVNGQPMQTIRSLAFALKRLDLSATPTTEHATDVAALARQEASTPFDLATGPLWRVTLARLGADDHLLLLTVHHIIADGWSMELLYRELAVLYRAFRQGQPSPLAPLPIQYADYARWQREQIAGERMKRQLAYWRQQLTAPQGHPPPPLALPTDRPRPAIQRYHGAHYPFVLPSALAAELRHLSLAADATLFMTLLSAFQVLLMRYSGQDDLVVGTPIANRHHLALEPIIGCFVNTLALRTNLAGNPTFCTLLAQVKATTLDAYRHQDLPFERVVEAVQPVRALDHTPLFQIMFDLVQSSFLRLDLPDLATELVMPEYPVAKFDLTLSIVEDGATLTPIFEYNTDLFDQTTIVRMADHFQTLLTAIVANPEQPINDLPLLTATERQQLLIDWAGTRVAPQVPVTKTIQQLFEEQVVRTPEAVAVLFDQSGERGRWGDCAANLPIVQSLTYAELNARANQLAHHLQQLGVGPERLVGLCAERSVAMVIGVLGILKAGGAYVPLDPDYPPERLAFMMQDAAPPVLVTQAHLRSQLPPTTATLVDLDGDWPTIAEQPTTNPVTRVGPETLAYVIYTSGSTGRPKGVLIEHGSLVAFSLATKAQYQLTPADRVLQFSTISFDAAGNEIYPCLLAGSTLVLRTEAMLATAPAFLQQCAGWGITVLTPPTAYWHYLAAEIVKANVALPPTVRLVTIGGERAQAPLARRWGAHLGAYPQLINEYGPTETTVVALRYPVTPGWYNGDDQAADLPIGRPLADVCCYILDAQLRPVPIGVVGELYLGGRQVARGYLNRPDLTAERFIPNPLAADPPRLYRTGDLVRYQADGNIAYVGRADDQVKIRGFRVELGEIEAMLQRHPLIQEAVVVLTSDQGAVGAPFPDDETIAELLEELAARDPLLPERLLQAVATPV